ncbi:hypothetical protein J7K86_02410, partial [bacterium]|nr:hypothetical protein [bacterium]
NLVRDLKKIFKNKKVKIILVKANVCRLLEKQLLNDKFNVINNELVIPFPVYGQQKTFAGQLKNY